MSQTSRGTWWHCHGWWLGGLLCCCAAVFLVAANNPGRRRRTIPSVRDRWGQPGDDIVLPAGPWVQDASDVEVRGNRLCARLRSADGSWSELTCILVQPGAVLENDAGRFRPQILDLPGGTWQGSSRNVRMEGNLLYAELQKDDLSYVSTYALTERFFRYRNDNGQFRRTNAACISLIQCLEGSVLKEGVDEIICPELYCDHFRDLDLCCVPAMPCTNLTICVLPLVPDPFGYCLGETCIPERDESVCCIAQAKCDSMRCRYGWTPTANASDIICDSAYCDEVIELDLCCDPAARCNTLVDEPECRFGEYFNDLEYCNGTVCERARDTSICCQSAANCDTMPCPNGWVAPVNLTNATFCDGPVCIEERDTPNCCLEAEPCDNGTGIVCPFGTFIPPETYCLGVDCFPQRDLQHCCRTAEPCASISYFATNCSFGTFFNYTDYCDGIPCDLERDASVCCQPAALCSTLECPYGYIAKPLETVTLAPDAEPVDSLFCTGLACDLARDRDTCCDFQASCLTMSCPYGFVGAWNVSDRLCLGPSCVPARDAPVCCESAQRCSAGYTCPHGYVPKSGNTFCDGTSCDEDRDLDGCCWPAMPCEALICPENFVTRPNQYCSKPSHVPNACTLITDLDTCCDRGMAFILLRFSPSAVKDVKSYQVQVAEFNYWFYGAIVNGTKDDEGGVAFSVDGNSPGIEQPEKAIDRRSDTKWLEEDPDPKYFPGKVFEFKAHWLQLPSPKPLDSFTFVTANDIPERDPITWRLEGSPDSIHWGLLHEGTGNASIVPDERQTETEVFYIKVPCFAPRRLYIPNSNDPYTCEQGDVISSGHSCTTKCAAGYRANPETLSCNGGKLDPPLFLCEPL